jgi:hypothetical protein
MSKEFSNAAVVLASGRTKAWAALKNVFASALVLPSRYHPEAHYMRGPGPKWREKHAKLSAQRR